MASIISEVGIKTIGIHTLTNNASLDHLELASIMTHVVRRTKKYTLSLKLGKILLHKTISSAQAVESPSLGWKMLQSQGSFSCGWVGGPNTACMRLLFLTVSGHNSLCISQSRYVCSFFLWGHYRKRHNIDG